MTRRRMSSAGKRWRRGIDFGRAAALACLSFWAGTAASTGQLNWNPKTGKVDASLQGEPLSKVLSDIGALAEWEVLVEPGLQATVSTRFEGLPAHQALRRILGNLNFAVLPGKNGRKKLYIYRNSLHAATKQLKPEDGNQPSQSRRIENEIIAALNADSPEDMETLAKSLNAKVIGKIDGLNAYRLRFQNKDEAEQARKKLGSLDSLQISDNYEMDIPARRLSSLHFGKASTPQIRANSASGREPLIVALIDTPVQADAPGLSGFLLPTVSLAGEESPPADQPTHGTTMALTLLRGLEMVNEGGASANVRILPIDVYGGEEMTSTFQVAAGVVEAMRSGARLFSVSLGGQETAPFLQRVIQDAHRSGARFVGAAGNEPGTHDIFPAAYPEFLAVTSSDATGRVAPYANNGGFVDVMAPGRTQVSYKGKTYLIKGTSVSTASVSGIVAGIAAESGLPLQQVERQIRSFLPKPSEN